MKLYEYKEFCTNPTCNADVKGMSVEPNWFADRCPRCYSRTEGFRIVPYADLPSFA